MNYAEHARLMFDLITIAFQTDMTRVATFMLAREGGVRPYPEIGVPEAHHSISHHGGDPALIEKLIQIECYHMEQFAYFVEKMKSHAGGHGLAAGPQRHRLRRVARRPESPRPRPLPDAAGRQGRESTPLRKPHPLPG